MSPKDVENLVRHFRNEEGVWLLDLPAEGSTFRGHPLQLMITTADFGAWWFWTNRTASPPTSVELNLVRAILLDLKTVVKMAEAALVQHLADETEALQEVDSPHIWIDRSQLDSKGPKRWALVVNRADWPDFGWHIEFDGLACVEVWAGD